jgi:putative DNA primase/helicase
VPVGDGWDVRRFSIWCPQAIAGIGRLPSTIADRSIVIQMKRKLRTETVAKLRRRDAGPLIVLARKVARWVDDHRQAIEEAVPEVPEGLNDRAADAWEICFAIADIAGGEWPARARKAALALSGDAVVEDDDVRAMLLSDIRAAFETNLQTSASGEHDNRGPRLASEDIVSYLAGLDERSWGEWKAGRPITKGQLARLLKPIGVSSGTIRLANGCTSKGYYLSAFADAFPRYLPDTPNTRLQPKPPFKTSQRHTPQESLRFGENQNVTDDLCDVSKNAGNPSVSAPCDGVTFRGGDSGPARASGADTKPNGAGSDHSPAGSKQGKIII